MTHVYPPLQSMLIKELKKEISVPNMSLILELLVKIYLTFDKEEDANRLGTWLTENQSVIQKHTSLSAAALPVTAIVVKSSIQCRNTRLVELYQFTCFCCMTYMDDQIT